MSNIAIENKPLARADIEPEFNGAFNMVSSLGDMLSALGAIGALGTQGLDDETIERAGATIFFIGHPVSPG
jgi:hypothetical protein